MLVNVRERTRDRSRRIVRDRDLHRSSNVRLSRLYFFFLFFSFLSFFLYVYSSSTYISSFFPFFLSFLLSLFRFSSRFFLSRNSDDHERRRRAPRRMNRLRFRRTIVGRGRFERKLQTYVESNVKDVKCNNTRRDLQRIFKSSRGLCNVRRAD